jgi:hypothetical protein
LVELAILVEREGRADEAEQLRTFGIVPGGYTAGPWGPVAR